MSIRPAQVRELVRGNCAAAQRQLDLCVRGDLEACDRAQTLLFDSLEKLYMFKETARG